MGDTSTGPLPTAPLPLGAFPLPFGFLLLPPGAETEPVRVGLLAGRVPREWPEALRGHQAALSGDLAAARAAFAGADPVNRFNRFVLDPETVDAAALRADLGDSLAVLVDLVEFATGRSGTAPGPGGYAGEIKALLLAAAAAEALSTLTVPGEPAPNGPVAPLAGPTDSRTGHGPAAPDLQRAAGAAVTAVTAGTARGPASPAALLREAIAAARPVSPALAGVLHGSLAQACKQAGDLTGAVAALQSGIALLAGTELAVARAEQHLELAATYHELAAGTEAADPAGMGAPGLLNQAVQQYHNALQEVSAESAAEVWAAAHTGLAAAYLTMPMTQASDRLRLGVAVGSLRAALTVYTPRTHPAEWSSAQLNLANALVYAPSAHQGDNLTEAVELYEAVLAVRSRDADPVGYARALANQGNALAHLGMTAQARAKLAEARLLFEESQDWAAAASVRGLLDELARHEKSVPEATADA